MLDKKTLNLLEMAERGELPPHTRLCNESGTVLICQGRLTFSGRKFLSDYRQEQQISGKAMRVSGQVVLATESDLTAIYSQLGELKYKVEKLEGCTKPCTCSCTKSEHPALEWEVWWKPDGFICACETNGMASEMLKARARLAESDESYYEVRHNPKRK